MPYTKSRRLDFLDRVRNNDVGGVRNMLASVTRERAARGRNGARDLLYSEHGLNNVVSLALTTAAENKNPEIVRLLLRYVQAGGRRYVCRSRVGFLFWGDDFFERRFIFRGTQKCFSTG